MIGARLTVITPCSRPQNLKAMQASLPPGCQWIVVLDRPNLDDVRADLYDDPRFEVHHLKQGSWGNPQRNLALSLAERDYVHFLDDDNIMHETLVQKVFTPSLKDEIIQVTQIYSDGVMRVAVKPVNGIGDADTAQFFIPREVAQQYRWETEIYQADGIYFSQIYKDHAHRFKLIPEASCYYNFLRPEART